jgi:predicted NUDIX family phosphoesterase
MSQNSEHQKNIMVINRSALDLENSGVFGHDIISVAGENTNGRAWRPRTALGLLLSHATSAVRATAETDETMLQVIPYITLVADNGQIFTYHRSKKSGEQRLVGKKAIGVGGHVEYDGEGDPMAVYFAQASKELKEEVGVDLDYEITLNAETVRGFIFNADDAVGRVHIGVWHVLQIPDELAALIPTQVEDHLADVAFELTASVEDQSLGEDSPFEGWSQIILRRCAESRKALEQRASQFLEAASQNRQDTDECCGAGCGCDDLKVGNGDAEQPSDAAPV